MAKPQNTDNAGRFFFLLVTFCRSPHRIFWQCNSIFSDVRGRIFLAALHKGRYPVAQPMISCGEWKIMDSAVRRGDIFYADLSPVVGSEQGGTRPVLIVQNDTGNKHSPTVIAAAITSQTGKARLPTHINIAGGSVGLSKDSVILLEQIRTIDKRRLREHMGRLDEKSMALVDDAIAVSFGLNDARM